MSFVARLTVVLLAGCAASAPAQPTPDAVLDSLRLAAEAGDPAAFAPLVHFPLDHSDTAYLPPPPPAPSPLTVDAFGQSRLYRLLTGDAMREVLAHPPPGTLTPTETGYRFRAVVPLRVRRYGTTLDVAVELDLARLGTSLRVVRARVVEA